MSKLQKNALVEQAELFKSLVLANKWESFIVAAAIFLGMFTFLYGDGKALTVYSVEMWDALFSGRILEYHTVTMENLRGSPIGGTSGGFISGIPWAIWNFPIWLTHTFGGNYNVLTTGCVLWSKLYLVLCVIATGIVCYHIIALVTKNEQKARLAPFLIWGSATVFISTGYAMQDEIAYVLAFLLAVYYLLKDKSKVSMAWLVVSVSLFPVMLAPALLLIICYTKNIFKILWSVILLVIPTILETILIAPPPQKPFHAATMADFFNWYFQRTTVTNSMGTISLYAIVLIGLYGLLYIRRFESKVQRNIALLYSLAICTLSMILLSWLHFYRLFTYLPFLLIVIFIFENEKTFEKGKVALFFLGVFECLLAIFPFFAYPEYFNTQPVTPLFHELFSNERSPGCLLEAISGYNLPIGIVAAFVTSSIFIVGLLLLYIVYPRNKGEYAINISSNVICKFYVTIPFLLILVFYSLPLWSNVLNIPMEDNSALTPGMDGKTSLAQYYYSEKNSISSIKIQPVTWGQDYPDTLNLCIDIIDLQTNKILSNVSIVADTLPDNQAFQIDLPPTEFKKERWYKFHFYASELIENENNKLYLLHSKEGTAKPDTHYATVNLADSDESIITDYDILTQVIAIN